jgi:Nickel responsive protein SCO4226-like
MPKYVIERNLPGAGQLSPAELAAVSDKSCSALRSFGSRVQWMQSYVTGDKIYCIYVAPSERLIREHARLAGFPVNRIAEIKAIIDPATSEAAAPEHDQIRDYAKEAGVY